MTNLKPETFIKSKELVTVLKENTENFFPVVPVDFQTEDFLILDLSAQNADLAHSEIEKAEWMTDYIFGKMNEAGVRVAVGGYNEERAFYRKSKVFNQMGNLRSIHLAIDIWMEEGTPVFAPLDGKIHSYQNNANFGDYGPTIILEHQLNDLSFYTLYGHLSLESMENIYENKSIVKSRKIGEIGNTSVNGGWTPHLHFQLIVDMLGKKGDFMGVADKAEREYYLQLCPNPNLILNIPGL